MSKCSQMSVRFTRRNSQLQSHHSCGACSESPTAATKEGSGGDKIVLRSGRKIDSAPSSQEEESAEDKKDVEDMFQGLTFVQCEKESCLKWRKITQEEAELYQDEPWFCCLNKNDPDHCRCDQPEEDQFVQLAESSGFHYTFSTLPAGTLVWAKMTGHIPWPSIITTDPETKQSFIKEGSTEFYHVEFLGRRHYHQWVSPLHIDPYGDGRKPEFPPDLQGKKKGKKKSIQFKRSDSLLRNKGYQKNFMFAAGEAEEMKSMPIEKRLLKCTYSYKEPKIKEAKIEPKEEHEKSEPKTGPNKEPTVESFKPVLREDDLPEGTVSESPRSMRARKRLIPSHQEKPEKPPEVLPVKSKKKGPSIEKAKTPSKPKEQSKCQKKSSKSKNSQQNLSQVLLQEERLFNGAWAHFMKNQGLVFDRKLSFDGSSLSAFRLFMSVQERGGYKEMRSSDWEAVSCELSKKPSADSCQASLLKKLYKRNLYPYQKHLLPKKKDDPNNNRMSLSSKNEPSPTTPNTVNTTQFSYPQANMSQMTMPGPAFVATASNGTAPSYPAPHSTGGPTVTQLNSNIPQSTTVAGSSSAITSHSYYGGRGGITSSSGNIPQSTTVAGSSSALTSHSYYGGSGGMTPSSSNIPQSTTVAGSSSAITSHRYYGGSGGISSSSGCSYGLTWKSAGVPVSGGQLNTRIPATTNNQPNIQAAPSIRGPNYQPMNNCTPLSSGSHSYGSNSGMVSSSMGSYGNPTRPVNVGQRGNMLMPASNGNGWQQKPPVQFNRDAIDIDNIIQALDRTEQFEQPTVGQGHFAKPYTVPYGSTHAKSQGRLPQTNYKDDLQCVPDAAIASTYNGRVSTPPSYVYPSVGYQPHQINDLVQETSRLDEVLQMEFSQL